MKLSKEEIKNWMKILIDSIKVCNVEIRQQQELIAAHEKQIKEIRASCPHEFEPGEYAECQICGLIQGI